MNDVLWTLSPDLIDDDFGEIEYHLAHLLINSVIFCNNGHWKKDWPKDHITVHVNCNDVFAWGCADSEDITNDEVIELYKMWRKDPTWGPAIWCIKKRNLMPQKPVYDAIKKEGIWDLDSMGLQK